MKQLILLTMTVLAIASSPPAQAGPATPGMQVVYAANDRGDYDKEIALLKPLVARGLPAAQSMLGYLYSVGQDVPQDFDKAVHYLSLASGGGYVDAMSYLGWMYESGSGVAQNDNEALKRYRQAQAVGDANAAAAVARIQAHPDASSAANASPLNAGGGHCESMNYNPEVPTGLAGAYSIHGKDTTSGTTYEGELAIGEGNDAYTLIRTVRGSAVKGEARFERCGDSLGLRAHYAGKPGLDLRCAMSADGDGYWSASCQSRQGNGAWSGSETWQRDSGE